MKKELPVKPLGRRADASSYCSREVRDPLPTSVSSDKEGKGDSQKVSLMLKGAFGEAKQTQKLDQLRNWATGNRGKDFYNLVWRVPHTVTGPEEHN